MSAFNYPIFNGVAASWADIQVRFAGVGITQMEAGDIKSINVSDDLEHGWQKEGGVPINRTAGEVTSSVSVVFYASGYQKFLESLISAAPLHRGQRRLTFAVFDINQLWTPFGATKILERRIKGCRVIGRHNDSAEGVDATEFEVPLSTMQIADVVNGVEVVLL